MIEKMLHNYRLISELGRGGMGVVYLAEHEVLHNRVALKVLPERFASSRTLIERFQREGKSMLSLEHQNIVRFMHFGVQDDTYFIVMELVEGQSLRELLDKKEPVSVTRALDITIQCCDALSYAHGKGIIHRDIKPGNILISKEGKVKVADFGLARIVGDEALSVGDLGTAIGEGSIGLIATKGSRLTKTGTSPGTVDYMSPEQREVGGETDYRTDVYSLGVVLYEMLTDRLPSGIAELPSEYNPSVSKGLDEIARMSLVGKKQKRYQGAEELRDALRAEMKRVEPERNGVRKGEQEEQAGTERDFGRKGKAAAGRPEASNIKKAVPTWMLLLVGVLISAGVVAYGIGKRKARWIGTDAGTGTTGPKAQVSLSALKQITNSIGMELVLVPAGEFMMGSPLSEKERDSDEGPQHKVQITQPFYIGKYEVTQSQYEAVMGDNPSHFKAGYQALTASNSGKGGRLDYPVERLTWKAAMEFCSTLSEKEELEYRLPTEAEWEYACRAGSTTAYYFGNDERKLGQYGWFYWNTDAFADVMLLGFFSGTRAVGQRRPNRWGLYDMHGNVWEWCSDRYSKGYYEHSPVADPKGPDSGNCRVLRGGSWRFWASSCRSASRFKRSPTSKNDNFGFRLVQTVQD